MTYFEALGEALRDLLEPAAVGATKVTTKGPKNSALADADVTVDVNGAARAIAVDAKQTFELPIDGVKLVAKANHHGDLSADVVASGLALSGLDVAVEGLARDTANATIGAKLAIDSVGITADSALAGGDIVASACYAFDDNTALGAKATVSPSSGGLADWTLAAQRRDGPTTLSAALSDGGNTVALGRHERARREDDRGFGSQARDGRRTQFVELRARREQDAPIRRHHACRALESR